MSNMDESPTAAAPSGDEGLFANILTPGSSLNPVFLHIVDGVLAILMFIFLALLILTRGSVHFVFLMIVTGCLWASVKWFVSWLIRRSDGLAYVCARLNMLLLCMCLGSSRSCATSPYSKASRTERLTRRTTLGRRSRTNEKPTWSPILALDTLLPYDISISYTDTLYPHMCTRTRAMINPVIVAPYRWFRTMPSSSSRCPAPTGMLRPTSDHVHAQGQDEITERGM